MPLAETSTESASDNMIFEQEATLGGRFDRPQKIHKMPPPDSHRIFDPWEALRRDRDRWAQLAMDQAEYIRQLEQEVQAYKNQLQALTKAEEESETLPQENDYQALVQWLAAEKTLGNNYYAEAGYNRSKMCRNLRKILGWEPDQNSLRKAENR